MPAQVYRSPVGTCARVGGRPALMPGLCGAYDLAASEFFEVLPVMAVFTVSSCEPIGSGNIPRWIIVHNDTALRVGDFVQTPHMGNVSNPQYAMIVRVLNSTTAVIDRPVPVGSMQDTTG